jgi:type IV pilus biogenesis protein PilP
VGKKKLLGWVVVAAAAAGAGGLLLPDERSQLGAEAQPAARSSKAEVRPQPEALALPSREGLGRPRGDLFAANTPPAPASKPIPEASIAVPEITAPPMPYRVAGQVQHEGPARVVLARDDRVYLVREGDVLDGGYRVESIKPDGVTLVYTPLELRQHLAAASALNVQSPPVAETKLLPVAEARPAQLRWDGPARVQAGSEFDVALKITSDQLVRGSPMQLSYDAKLLEPVAVRAGEFFAEGTFTYRVNPGSIFVGAFGKGAVPEDAEFVVVTFKPVRAGTTAELKLSSMVLQGVAGGAVVHEPLAAFRTSITQ